jgi:hypothetical protein
VDKLIEQLRAQIQTKSAGKCLLWVDPAQQDPYEDDKSVGQRRVRITINHTHFAQHRTPYLVPLDLMVPGDADLFYDSVERAWLGWDIRRLRARHGQSICGWVVTKTSAETLANHWGRRCHIHGHRYKCKLLRFQDPGVREWLWPTLSEVQRHALLGYAACVFAIGRDQGLLCHESASDDIPSDRFELDDQQWQQVGNYATIHAAWLACTVVDPHGFHSSFSPAVLLAVLIALDQATHYGVTQPSERALYGRHALQLGSRFHVHGRMQAVWEQTRTGHYYGSAVEQVFSCAADELCLHWNSIKEQTGWPT